MSVIHQVYERVLNRAQRELRKRKMGSAPVFESMSYSEPNVNWYEPVIAGADTFRDACTSAKTVREAVAVLDRLTPDSFILFLKNYYNKGLKTFGDRWAYSDIVIALCGICQLVNIERYLEIGVRRGRSMAMVAAKNPNCHIVGFDLWLKSYVGIENPGPDFVRSEMAKVGFSGSLELISGNSQKTVPAYFKTHPDTYFDLITVDGDHTRPGAARDIRSVVPRLKRGGLLVFDDIVNHYHPFLNEVWNREVKDSGRFSTFEFVDSGYGVAVAIKKY